MTVGIRTCQAHGSNGAYKEKETEPVKSAGERRDGKRSKNMVT